jgi:hypothetical protein
VIVLHCPNCGNDRVGTNDTLTAVGKGEWVHDDESGERTFASAGYSDVLWDSAQTDPDSPCYCQSCDWSGPVEDLVRP